MSLSKSKIVQQFNRAASDYDCFAGLQGDISAGLLKRVDAFASPRKNDIAIADFGCGTGAMIKSLSELGYRNLFGFDIAEKMLEEAKQKCPHNAAFACGDIESLAVKDDAFDIIVSNAAIQWCRSENVCAEMKRTLAVGGRAFVCTFGPQTLRQWQAAFGANRIHTFESAEQIKHSIDAARLNLLTLETELVDAEFDSVAAMFNSVRRIGASNANRASAERRISKTQYQAAHRDFENTLATQGKLSLTYEVITVVAEKAL
jgi:malonyl-CoA O-methyltransferase